MWRLFDIFLGLAAFYVIKINVVLPIWSEAARIIDALK